MPHQSLAVRPLPARTFLRVIGLVWLSVMSAIGVGAILAPHMGFLTDVILNQTSHRRWIAITLTSDQPRVESSTPLSTVKSYYRTLYWGDVAQLEHLTQGAFGEQIRQRLPYLAAAVSAAAGPYHSYLYTETQREQTAVVVEKLHLFWQRGLRFYLQRTDTGWRITHVALLL
jgi:hypothetical protein